MPTDDEYAKQVAGNIKAMVERLAHEIGRRVADDTGEPELALTVENEARDVLLDYWLGKLPPEG